MATIGRFIQRDPAGYPNGPNNYLYCGNNPVNFVDPLGLAGKDVKKSLLDNIQNITNDIMDNLPDEVTEMSAEDKGTWVHTKLKERLKELKDPRILTEQGIKDMGIMGFGDNHKRPDIIILKEGTNVDELKKGTGLRGKVDAVVDLKTGDKGIRGSWLDDVSTRLDIATEDVYTLRKGGNLADDVAKAGLKNSAAKNILKSGATKTLGHAFVIGSALWAFHEARAEHGMSKEEALAYAGLSVVGGDLVYEGAKVSSQMIESTSEVFGKAYKNNLLSIGAVEKMYGKGKNTSDVNRDLNRAEKRGSQSFGELRNQLLY